MCGITVLFTNISTNTSNPKTTCIQHRGPDEHVIHKRSHDVWIFDRLSINDVTFGSQPFIQDEHIMICNGEIYNHKDIGEGKSLSDCEPLFHRLRTLPCYDDTHVSTLCNELDAEFAFVYANSFYYVIARDPLGVRPLFYAMDDKFPDMVIGVSSEAKMLMENCSNVSKIQQFPPGHCWVLDIFGNILYHKKYVPELNPKAFINMDDSTSICKQIHDRLTKAVEKRLMSDRPIGFFLSGGLDSSIIASIGAKLMHPKQITTYSIGTKGYESPDLIAAKQMAEYLNTNHIVVEFTIEEAFEQLRNVIWHLESYDCTTIRASVPMYLLCNKIKQMGLHQVLLSGEGADELFGGYLYLHNAPSNADFQQETLRLLQDVHEYDLVRADRCTAAHGLELRVPFFDKALVDYVISLDPSVKRSKTIEKKILRDAFTNELPNEIVNRQKNGMSDAVGYSWVDALKEFTQKTQQDTNFQKYSINTPISDEEMYYRQVYHELFGNRVITHRNIWRPRWTRIMDPSARQLNVFNS